MLNRRSSSRPPDGKANPLVLPEEGEKDGVVYVKTLLGAEAADAAPHPPAATS